VNRRQFLVTTAALNVPVLAARPVFAASWSASGIRLLDRVVADSRFAQSVAFAAAMAKTGARVSMIDGDPATLWFGDLAGHFAINGAPIAGLTTARTALVMIELAKGPGVRILWHSEHRALAEGSLQHEMLSPPSSGALATQIRQSLERTTVGGLEETLSSWVLAPRAPGANSPT
jgi:hypothetical protein